MAGKRVLVGPGMTVWVLTPGWVSGEVQASGVLGKAGVVETVVEPISVSRLEATESVMSCSPCGPLGVALGHGELDSAGNVAQETLATGSCRVGEGDPASVPELVTTESVTSGDTSDVVLRAAVVWEEGIHGTVSSGPLGEMVQVGATEFASMLGWVTGEVPWDALVPWRDVVPSSSALDVTSVVTQKVSRVAV